MTRLMLLAAVYGALGMWLSAAWNVRECSAQTCHPVPAGLDTTQANTSGGWILGESLAQTFVASDTLIRSLTVWRVPNQAGGVWGMHLRLTTTNALGVPRTDEVIFDGPDVFNTGGDGIHPTPFRWDFDPPISLPSPGTYAFFLTIAPCRWWGYFDVLGRESTDNAYPGGHVWWTPRLFDCSLDGPLNQNLQADMIFTIEFCDVTTPVRGKTWGEVKAIYR